MAEFAAMPLWTDAYLGDTTHLTTIEHGAYLLLLITAWRTKNGMLPDDDRLLARYTKLGPSQWKRIRPVLEPFFDIEDGFWKQGRLLDERVAVKRQSKRQSNNAKSRWLKNNKTDDATAMPDGCQPDAPLPLPIREESIDGILEQTNTESIDTGRAKRASKYFFEGLVIRLNKADYETWLAKFFGGNAEAFDRALRERDVWLADLPVDDQRRKKWFLPTSNWLRQEGGKLRAPANQPGRNGPNWENVERLMQERLQERSK